MTIFSQDAHGVPQESFGGAAPSGFFVPSRHEQDTRIKIHALYAKAQAFKKPKPAPIKQFHDKVIGRRQMLQDGIDFFTG